MGVQDTVIQALGALVGDMGNALTAAQAQYGIPNDVLTAARNTVNGVWITTGLAPYVNGVNGQFNGAVVLNSNPTGIAGWTLMGTGTFAANTSPPAGPPLATSVRATANGSSSSLGANVPSFPCYPGITYVLMVFGNPSAGSLIGDLGVTWTGTGIASGQQSIDTQFDTVPASTWSTFTASFTAPAGATFGTPRFYLANAGAITNGTTLDIAGLYVTGM